MRLTLVPTVLAVLLALVLLLAAPMADAGHPEVNSAEESHDRPAEAASEHMRGHNEPTRRGKKSHKPRLGNMGVRQKWEECVGMDATEAIDLIKAARPDLRKVVRVPQGAMVTADMRYDRVRVFCNEAGIVTRPPRVG